MGNVENKTPIQSPTNDQRSRVGRFFNGIFSRARTLSNENITCGTLSPVTEHDGECPVCFQPNPILLRYSSCSHMACTLCWLTFLCTEIDSFAMSRLTCIACKNPLPAATVVHMLTTAIKDPESYVSSGSEDEPLFSYAHCARMLSRYEEFLLRKALSREPDVRWCPSGCGYGLIAHGFKACPRLYCLHPECHGRSFCYNCQRPWHPSMDQSVSSSNPDADDSATHTCVVENEGRNDTVEGVMALFGVRRLRRRASAMSELSPNHSTASHRFSYSRVQSNAPCISEECSSEPPDHTPLFRRESGFTNERSTEAPRHSTISQNSSDGGEIKACPRCKSMIQKMNDGSCNDMVCVICGFNFCWLCLRENTVGHYISLSGCTVWGRQQWSTRRRLFTLIGLLLGTPILLPIIVAVGIPAGSIALIVGLCYMVRGLIPGLRKNLRRLVVFIAFLNGLVLGPIVASIIAAFLVPIVLSYVYIYLPISVFSSLCRKRRTKAPVAIPTDGENSL